MKFGFVTCVELGLACLDEIDTVGGKLDVVITLKDDLAQKKSGRIFVDDFCRARRVEILKVKNVNDSEVLEAARKLDWLFIIGWSQIAKAPLLQAPRRGVLGMHPTLLPEGRGRAAVPWAILKNLPETGVTLFQLDEGVDTGPILAQERLPIAPDETATTLYRRVCQAHRSLIRRVWQALVEDRITPVAQDSARASEWPGRTPADGAITSAMTVAEADRLVRATTRPYPGAFWLDDAVVIRVWSGRPADSAQAALTGAKRIALADGFFDAIDYEVEPHSAEMRPRPSVYQLT